MCEPNTGYDWERIRIMPPRMTTRIVGRATAAPRGGRMGGWTSRGGGRTRGRSGDQGNGRIDGQGGQVGGQGSESNDHRGCTYKEFLACNPKEYDGKGGALVYTRWIKKMESVQDMSGCKDNQKVKYTASSFVSKALMWDEFCPSNELQNLETELRNHTMVRVGYAAYTNRNVNLVNAKNPAAARGACYECGGIDHYKSACPRVVGTMVTRHVEGHLCWEQRSFVSTTFIPLLGIEPSDLEFSYDIEIAIGQLVENDEVIKGCKLEIEQV
ncbi:hypothetical protein Tco_0641641 [Tanacetum coccineum]